MQEIIAALLRAGAPFRLPVPWSRFPCHQEFFTLPADRASLLRDLRERFSEESLVTAGVLGADTADFHSDLLTENAPIWAMRTGADQGATRLIANMRVTGSNRSLVSTALNQFQLDAQIEASDRSLFVAYSMADCAVLKSLGLAVIPGSNWQDINNRDLTLLRKLLKIPASEMGLDPGRPDAPEPSFDCPLTLILANWSLARLGCDDMSDALATWRHLGQLYLAIQLEIEDWCLWKPSHPNDLHRLELQIHHLSAPQIGKLLLDSVDAHSISLGADKLKRQSADEIIANCHRQFRKCERSTTSRSSATYDSYDNLMKQYDKHHFESLLEKAFQTEDLVERNAMLALSQVSRLLLPQLIFAAERSQRDLIEKGASDSQLQSPKALSPISTLLGQFLSLTKEVNSWKQNRSNAPIALSTSTPRSNPWASGH